MPLFRIVLDTNVLVSALIFRSPSVSWLLSAWQSVAFIPLVSPLIAQGLHDEGWTKRDVQLYLYERARIPVERVRRYKELRYGRNVEAGDPYFWPKWLDTEGPETMLPVVRDPDNIMIVVAGDPARSRSAYCPPRPYNRPVCKPVWMAR